MVAATSALTVVGAIALLLSSLGGAAALATLARGGFLHRRSRQRREDALWGFTDEDGVKHGGLIQEWETHIADRTIHNYGGTTR